MYSRILKNNNFYSKYICFQIINPGLFKKDNYFKKGKIYGTEGFVGKKAV